MDVWRITVAALRRWYILLPLLALTGLAAYTVGNGVHPEYDSTGSVMVVPGQAGQTVPNPYGRVADANTVLGIVLNGPGARSQIGAKGLSTEFAISTVSRSTIANFTVRADDPDIAIATGQAVLDHAVAELDSRQASAGVPENERYTLEILQAPALTGVVTEGKLRNMAIVGVLGAAGSLVVAVLFDDIVGLIRRRRNRKKRSKTDESPSADKLDVSDLTVGDPQSPKDAAHHSDDVDALGEEQHDDDRAPELAVHDSR